MKSTFVSCVAGHGFDFKLSRSNDLLLSSLALRITRKGQETVKWGRPSVQKIPLVNQ